MGFLPVSMEVDPHSGQITFGIDDSSMVYGSGLTMMAAVGNFHENALRRVSENKLMVYDEEGELVPAPEDFSQKWYRTFLETMRHLCIPAK